MASRSWRWTAGLVGTVACGAGCDRTGNEFVAPPPPQVTVATPDQQSVTRYLTYTGVIEALETVELRARVAGFLSSIHFEPGQDVKKGDLLFTIDKREYVARVNEARARLSAAVAELDLAEVTLERVKDAFRLDAASELEVREKQAARDQAAAAVELAKANLQTAELDLEYCEVRSPVNGRIDRNRVDVGNLVGRNEPTLLAVITDAKDVYVTVDASEDVLLDIRRELQQLYADGRIKPGQTADGQQRTAELSLADREEFEFKGHIDYVSPTLDAGTGTIQVRGRFDNSSNFLVPGLFVRLRVPRETRDAMLVPDAALLTDQVGRYALVVDDKGMVEQRRVQIGAREGPMRVVVNGLAPTDRVVVKGVQRARPGLAVTPVVEKAQAPDAAPAPGGSTGSTN